MNVQSHNEPKESISPELLLQAYSDGVFPMADEGEVLWFSPEQRGVVPLDDRFHIRKSLKRVLKKHPFRVEVDTVFREVMLACADRDETWIDSGILESYCTLHELGFAHSVECWDDDGLQGGLYGVALGRAFFGESMFSRKTDASKVAMVYLVEMLRNNGFVLLDTQWMTDHLRQFGGYELPRHEYLAVLKDALADLGLDE